LYNQTPVANGGTGRASVASGNLLIGAGTSAMTLLAGAALNDVVTWNGSAWISQVGAGGAAPVVTIYNSPSPWSKPASLKAVKVTVLSGGGGGAGSRTRASTSQPQAGGGGGGAGGFGFFPAASIPASPISVTVGAAGTAGIAPGTVQTVSAGGSGGTSSFGALITATGGAGAPAAAASAPTPGGAAGTFTPSPTQIGRPGIAGTAGSLTTSGAGGNSFQLWGIGGAALGGNGAGIAGTGYGAGGGGGATTSGGPAGSVTGGAGTAGYVIVEEFY